MKYIATLLKVSGKACVDVLLKLIPLSCQDKDGETALHMAIISRELGCLRELVKAKVDLNCVNFKLERPIHVAVHKDFPQ